MPDIAKVCYYLFGLSASLYLLYLILPVIWFEKFKQLIGMKMIRVLIISILPTFIFLRLFRNDAFFLSDDFAHLAYVSSNSYWEIVKVAVGHGIWVGHHIIGGFLLFKLIYDLFGVNVNAFNLVVYLFNLIMLYNRE